MPRLRFADWLARFEWEQGQHVSLIGPTGQGKTVLTRQIAPRRDFVVVLAVKKKDPGLEAMIRQDGYLRIDRWDSERTWWGGRRPPRPWRDPDTGRWVLRVVLWPDFTARDEDGRRTLDLDAQRDEFTAFLSDALDEGGYTAIADDVSWLCEMLHLELLLKAMWKQGRSSGVSLLANIQRPRFVPLDAYSQASHVVMWQTADEEDLRRVSGIGGLPVDPIRAIVRDLPEHEFLSVAVRGKFLAVSKVA